MKLVEEANGGTCTGKPTEIVQCNEKECLVDGKYFSRGHRCKITGSITNFHLYLFYDIVDCEWNEWIIGTCSSSCGGGLRTNTRSKIVSAEHDGEDCNGTTSITESCNVKECPGNTLFRRLVLANYGSMSTTLLKINPF